MPTGTSYAGPHPQPSNAKFVRTNVFPSPGGFPGKAPSLLTGTGATLFIVDSTLPGVTVNVPYSQTLTAGGGIGSYTFSVFSGTLPTGLSLNTSTGVISGTPTVIGASTFTIKIVDSSSNVGTQSFTITVAAVSGGNANYGYAA